MKRTIWRELATYRQSLKRVVCVANVGASSIKTDVRWSLYSLENGDGQARILVLVRTTAGSWTVCILNRSGGRTLAENHHSFDGVIFAQCACEVQSGTRCSSNDVQFWELCISFVFLTQCRCHVNHLHLVTDIDLSH